MSTAVWIVIGLIGWGLMAAFILGIFAWLDSIETPTDPMSTDT